jgi:hypothetical protein
MIVRFPSLRHRLHLVYPHVASLSPGFLFPVLCIAHASNSAHTTSFDPSEYSSYIIFAPTPPPPTIPTLHSPHMQPVIAISHCPTETNSSSSLFLGSTIISLPGNQSHQVAKRQSNHEPKREGPTTFSLVPSPWVKKLHLRWCSCTEHHRAVIS